MFAVGTIVRAMAGRDKGRYYAVVKLEGQTVFIADGKLRRLGKPKKKNIKHLQPTAQHIAITPTLTDKQLKKALTNLD